MEIVDHSDEVGASAIPGKDKTQRVLCMNLKKHFWMNHKWNFLADLVKKDVCKRKDLITFFYFPKWGLV